MRDATLRLPEARFSCQSCGRCCTLWSVTVDATTVAALRRHDWSHVGRGDPFERNRGPGEPYRLRLVDGRCFFLDADRRCCSHSELGYEAKPEGCKAFPLHFTSVAGTSYGRLSFYCPSVSANQGRPLREQQRWARAVLKRVGAGAHPSEISRNSRSSWFCHPRQWPDSLYQCYGQSRRRRFHVGRRVCGPWQRQP